MEIYVFGLGVFLYFFLHFFISKKEKHEDFCKKFRVKLSDAETEETVAWINCKNKTQFKTLNKETNEINFCANKVIYSTDKIIIEELGEC